MRRRYAVWWIGIGLMLAATVLLSFDALRYVGLVAFVLGYVCIILAIVADSRSP